MPLIANELIDECHRCKESSVVLKLNIEKAFDKVDWDFVDLIVEAKGFDHRWRKWIKGCISSPNFSIIINGKPWGKIFASRGLRQDDPLSPFLFTLVMDCLSRNLSSVKAKGLIKGFVVGKEPKSLSITHLQFANDTILFSSPRADHIDNLFATIQNFVEAYGLNINRQKSELLGILLQEFVESSLVAHLGCKVE